MQSPTQHARMNIELPSHGHEALSHCNSRKLLVQYLCDLLLVFGLMERPDMLA
jgi:hypothetical protein